MTLRLRHADEVGRAALRHARESGVPACVAVCDGNGRLVVFFKADGTDAMGGHEAIGRAIAAAGSGGPSERAEPNHGRASTVAAEGPGFSTNPGGLPLTSGGECVGGVGVCGGDDGHAVACAQAGAAAFQRDGGEDQR